jgi:hemin uptake protein HemP
MHPSRSRPDQADASASADAAARPVRTVSSETLFAGEGELVIVHRGDPYRLRITRQGKLILTK